MLPVVDAFSLACSDKNIKKLLLDCQICIERDKNLSLWSFMFVEIDVKGRKTGKHFFVLVDDKKKRTVIGGM